MSHIDLLDIVDRRLPETIEALKQERDKHLAAYVNACSQLAQAHAVKQLREAMGATVASAAVVGELPRRRETGAA